MPGVAAAVVIGFIGVGLACKYALHGFLGRGECSDVVALLHVVVAHRQIQGDEGGVVLARQSGGIDLFTQVEQAGQMVQKIAE